MYVKTFYVWRRKDGYVGVSTSDAGREKNYENDGRTLLLMTRDWEDASAFLAAERAKDKS